MFASCVHNAYITSTDYDLHSDHYMYKANTGSLLTSIYLLFSLFSPLPLVVDIYLWVIPSDRSPVVDHFKNVFQIYFIL